MEKETFIPARDVATVKYCGTWQPDGDAMVSYWNVNYAEIDFTGGRITVVFPRETIFRYRVDDGAYSEDQTVTGDYTVTLPDTGRHTLRIRGDRRTRSMVLGGFRVPAGAEVFRTPNRAHYIQFVGDSISDGGFSYRTGDALGWDTSVVALSGMSLSTSLGYWSVNNPKFYALIGEKIGMEDAFFRLGYPEDSTMLNVADDGTVTVKPGYEGYADYLHAPSVRCTYEGGYFPDIVFIFLGTNDALQEENPENSVTFLDRSFRFAENILATYGKDTKLCFLQALTNSKWNEDHTGGDTRDTTRYDTIREAVRRLQAKYGTEQVRLIDRDEIEKWNVEICYKQNDPTHPTGEGHMTIQRHLIPLLHAFYD